MSLITNQHRVRAEEKLGIFSLFLINTLMGMGWEFVDIIDDLKKGNLGTLSHQDILLARNWWVLMLPTPSLRRFARRLPILLSDVLAREARSSTRVTEANRILAPYLSVDDGAPLTAITAAELHDVWALSHWNEIHNPELHHPWAGYVISVRNSPHRIQAAQLPANVYHHTHRFRFWLSAELKTAGVTPSHMYEWFFHAYISWLTNDNPITFDRNRK